MVLAAVPQTVSMLRGDDSGIGGSSSKTICESQYAPVHLYVYKYPGI